MHKYKKNNRGRLFLGVGTPGSITGVPTTEMSVENMLLLVDTLSFAAKFEDENALFEFLRVDKEYFEYSYSSQQNYKYSYYFQGIILSFGGQAQWSCYVHMSGKGCRTFEDLRGEGFDWSEFLKDACNHIVDFRRIDIAADDTSGIITFDKADQAYRAGKVAGRARHFEVTYGDKRNFQAGSKNSNCLIRLYDKALERGFVSDNDEGKPWKRGEIDGHPWTRCEMQLRDPYAGQFIYEWLGSGDLASVFCGHVLEQLRFTKQYNDKRNAQRLETASWWEKFLGGVEKIKFVSHPGSDYNMARCEKYLFNQVAGAMKAWIEARQKSPKEVYEQFTKLNIHLNDNHAAMVKMYRGDNFDPDTNQYSDRSEIEKVLSQE